MNKNEYAANYNKRATSQNEAGKTLLKKLSEYRKLNEFSSVADIGCGSGRLTAEVYDEVNPDEMVGYDSSPEMIDAARKQHFRENLTYIVKPAELISEVERYDLIFSNSSFQWLTDQKKALKAMHRSLRKKGLIAVQSSAKSNWCPQFLSAISEVANHPATSAAFKNYKFPVTHHETANDYKELFEMAGFDVKFCEIAVQQNKTDLNGALNIFKSGAAKAYLFQDYFVIEKPPNYDEFFMQILESGLKPLCNAAGEIIIEYPRVFIIAGK